MIVRVAGEVRSPFLWDGRAWTVGSSSPMQQHSPFRTHRSTSWWNSYAVHHLPDRHAARSEIMRVLKPGRHVL